MKLLHLCLCLALPSALALAQQPADPASAKDSPQAIHASAIIIDTHADPPQLFLDENFDLGQNTPVSAGHIDLGKIKEGNLCAEFFSIWVEPDFRGHYAKRTMDLIDSVYQQAARHPDRMTMAF